MEAPAGFLAGLAFFQLALGVALCAHRWRETRFLALAFLFNGASTLAFGAEQGGLQGLGWVQRLFDVPTGGFIAAFALDRYFSQPFAAKVVAVVMVVGAIPLALLPGLNEGAPDTVLRAWPLYAAYALLLLGASRTGERTDALVALAFLPRAVEFGAEVLPNFVLVVAAASDLNVLLNGAGTTLLLGVAVVATSWVVHRADPRFRAPAVGLFAAALLLAAGKDLIPLGPASGNAYVLIDQSSLGALRTALCAVAFLGIAALAPLAGIAIGSAAGAAAVSGAAGAWFGLGPEVALMYGFAGGALLLSLAAWAVPGVGKAAAPRPEGGPPQWVRLMLHLRGSSDRSRKPQPGWTQKELARATGIPVQRVSEFSETLNRRAERRLQEHVPDWKGRFGPVVPALVVKHRGAVEGLPGVQVYYRLTDAGEAMAGGVEHAPIGSSAGIRSPDYPLPPP